MRIPEDMHAPIADDPPGTPRPLDTTAAISLHDITQRQHGEPEPLGAP
ncbi:MAG: hypothetical protein ACC645_14495 [Pirellulales bacterium]